MLKVNVIQLYCEPCDCGLQIRHNNGGNYHTIDRLHIIGDENNIYCVILEETTTREGFPGDQYEYLTFQDGGFQLEEDKLKAYPVRFRQGEAKIIWQNPKAFIESRLKVSEWGGYIHYSSLSLSLHYNSQIIGLVKFYTELILLNYYFKPRFSPVLLAI